MPDLIKEKIGQYDQRDMQNYAIKMLRIALQDVREENFSRRPYKEINSIARESEMEIQHGNPVGKFYEIKQNLQSGKDGIAVVDIVERIVDKKEFICKISD